MFRARLLPALFLLAFPPLHAQKDVAPKPIDPQTITSAHSVYATEWAPDPPSPADPLTYTLRDRDFINDLKATHRFTLLPTTRGADLILLTVDTSHGDFNGQSGDYHLVNARDPRTFADLGTLRVKNTDPTPNAPPPDTAVALVHNLLALDHGAFQPPSVPPAETGTPGPPLVRAPFFSLITGTHESIIAAAKKVFVTSLDMGPLISDYRASATEFAADLQAAAYIQLVPSIQNADLVLILRGDSECTSTTDANSPVPGQSYCQTWQDFLHLDVYDATTFEWLTTMAKPALEGKIKPKKPTPFQTTIAELQKNFAGMYAKEVRNVAKAQSKH